MYLLWDTRLEDMKISGLQKIDGIQGITCEFFCCSQRHKVDCIVLRFVCEIAVKTLSMQRISNFVIQFNTCLKTIEQTPYAVVNPQYESVADVSVCLCTYK